MGDKGKRSTWRVADRCLDILVRLMAGPATSRELLDIVHDYAVEDEESTEREALIKRFEEDRGRIRQWLGNYSYDRATDEYSLLDLKRPLLNLPDNAVRGLVFLQRTFSAPEAPMRDEVEALVNSIMRVLPTKRHRDIQDERGLMELDLKPRDDDMIGDSIWTLVRQACTESRLLELEYRANRNDGMIVTHHLEPMRYYFDPIFCHFYLEGFCLKTWSDNGCVEHNVLRQYRLGRIVDGRLLPKHFARGRRHIPKVELVYELTPDVARLGVTQHFENSHIFYREDGGAQVRAMSTNLFQDVRRLLRYGANCRVIGGDEAVQEMKKIIQAMYEVYQPST